MSYDQKFLEHLTVIDRAVAFVARKRGLNEADAEDFGADVKLKLVDNDYFVLREYRGNDQGLATYLRAVVANYIHDWCNAKWGRWRPTAEARRQGPVAVAFERLTHRDGWSFDEACALLRGEFGEDTSEHEVAELAASLPQRSRRTLVGLDTLSERSDDNGSVEDQALRREAASQAQSLLGGLRQALRELDAEDRLILRMRFCDNVRIVNIAKTLGIEQKPLYRRIEGILRRTREAVSEHGLQHEEIAGVLSQGWPETADEGRLFE